MIPMPSATTMIIITEKVTNAGITTAKDMSAETIMAMKAAAIITVKIMSADIITEKASTAVMRRVTKAAAIITASKPLQGQLNDPFTRSAGRFSFGGTFFNLSSIFLCMMTA